MPVVAREAVPRYEATLAEIETERDGWKACEEQLVEYCEREIDRADEAEAAFAAKEAECEALRLGVEYVEHRRQYWQEEARKENARADALALACAAKDERIGELVEALEPFADFQRHVDSGDWTDDSTVAEEIVGALRRTISFGDLRRAARLIQSAAESQDHATSGEANHIGDATNMVAPTPGGSDD